MLTNIIALFQRSIELLMERVDHIAGLVSVIIDLFDELAELLHL